MSSEVAVAVVCGVVASLSYALSNVLQQHEAEQMADEDTLGIGLLTKLAHRPPPTLARWHRR